MFLFLDIFNFGQKRARKDNINCMYILETRRQEETCSNKYKTEDKIDLIPLIVV